MATKYQKTGTGTWTITFNVTPAQAQNGDVTVIGENMGSDTIPLEFRIIGTTWNATTINGTAVELSATNTHIPISEPGEYRLNYTGSEANIGVYVVGTSDGSVS